MTELGKSKVQATGNTASIGPAVKQDVRYDDRLLEIRNRIHAASNTDEILIDLKADILELFESERLTVYIVDGIKKELVSRVKSGDEISEIRVPISTASLSGYVANKGRLINIKNVYDDKELAAIDPKLTFDKTWDQKSGF